MNQLPTLSWGAWLAHIAKYSALGGAIYLLGLFLAQLMGLVYSSMPDWIFRLTFIIIIMWGVWAYRLRLLGRVTFLRGFGTGMAITIGLAAMLSFDSFVFQNYLEPDYHQKSKEIYELGTRNKMVVKYLQDHQKPKLSPEDEVLIQSGVQKHLEKVGYFFTTEGSVFAIWIYSMIWGLGLSLTIAFLSRPTNS